MSYTNSRNASRPLKPQKQPYNPLSKERLQDYAAEYKDDVLSKLTAALIEAQIKEGWSQRDLANLIGCKESQLSHIFNGRRKNLTTDTISAIARALQKRPELALIDVRPKGNAYPTSNWAVQIDPVQTNTSADIENLSSAQKYTSKAYANESN